MSKRLPIGNHYVCIVSIETKDNAKGDGKNKAVTLECISGDNKGARHTLYWPVVSGDLHALRMAERRELEYIVSICGEPKFDGSNLSALADLTFRPFMVALEPSKAEWLSAKPTPCPAEHLIDSEEACEGLRKRLVPTAPGKGGGLQIIRVADVEAEAIEWLWPQRFAVGKLSILTGDPGLGKSQFSLMLAAKVSRGEAWPNGEGTAPHGNVLLLSCEDEIGDTIRPRLEAAEADLENVAVLKSVATGDGKQRMFNLQSDLEQLDKLLGQYGGVIKLVIIDPISAYMGDKDTYKAAEVRSVLDPVTELAAKHDVAIVCVAHPPKMVAGGKGVNAVGGSQAFVAVSRSAWLFKKEMELDEESKQAVETGRVLMTEAKNNLGRATALALTIQQKPVPVKGGRLVDAPYVFIEGEVEAKADEPPQGGGFGRKAINRADEARAFLTDELRDGPQPAFQLLERAKAKGISSTTLQRARESLAIVARKNGMDGGWVWAFQTQPHALYSPLFPEGTAPRQPN